LSGGEGEAVVCGPDGVAIFDALHRRGTVTEAMLYAFDLLELDGEDLRGMPLGDRKKRLARLLGGRRLGIVLSDHTDDDGATIFQHACKLGLEGIASEAPERALPVGAVEVAVTNSSGDPNDPSVEKINRGRPRADHQRTCNRFKDGVSLKVAVNDPSEACHDGEGSPLRVH
jgi:hypothetical protein